MGNILLECQDLSKVFTDTASPVQVLSSLNLTVQAGEHLAIIGRSGSGKTTLLNLLAGLEAPTSGQVRVKGQDIYTLSAAKRQQLRNKVFGFIFQAHFLLPEFTALENVCMPLLIGGVSTRKARKRGLDFLERVGLADRVGHKPGALSGGERQRVAIARALVTEPECVFADEPTGNLDDKTAQAVHAVMVSLATAVGTSFIVVTHDKQLAQQIGRVEVLSDGNF